MGDDFIRLGAASAIEITTDLSVKEMQLYPMEGHFNFFFFFCLMLRKNDLWEYVK
jgi:hypothetical protein